MPISISGLFSMVKIFNQFILGCQREPKSRFCIIVRTSAVPTKAEQLSLVGFGVFPRDFCRNISQTFLCHERSFACRLGYSVLVPQRHGRRVQQRQASRRQQDRGASVNSSVAPEGGGPRLGRESRRRCWRRWHRGSGRACPGLSWAGRQRCERQQVAVVNVPPGQPGADTEWGPPRSAVQRALQCSRERSSAYTAQDAPGTEVGTGPLPALLRCVRHTAQLPAHEHYIPRHRLNKYAHLQTRRHATTRDYAYLQELTT